MFKDAQNLIERCIMREEKAWEEFIERFSGLLFYSAQERLERNDIAFGKEDLEDIVQTTFAEILERGRLKEVRERKRIDAWLSIMAQTRALNYMVRRKERLLRKEEFYKIDNIEARPIEGAGEVSIDEVEKAIEQFRPREKIIFKLNIIYGKTHKEIARFMGIPINTVSTIIARKRKVLRKKFKNL